MVPIPVSLRFVYSETKGMYREVGTHRFITIAQYEALEKRQSKRAENLVKVAAFCLVICGLVLATFLIGIAI